MRYAALATWLEEEFLPWQTSAQNQQANLLAVQRHLRQDPGALKQIIGLIFDRHPQAAAAAWNALGLPLELQAIHLSPDEAVITLTHLDESTEEIPTDAVISGLEQLLKLAP